MVLEMPPLPRLTWDSYSWEGEITLLTWRGFRARVRGGSRRDSTGRVRIHVDHKPLSQRPVTVPTDAQRAACAFLLEHEAAIATVVQRVFLPYARQNIAAARAEYDDTTGMHLPDVKSVNDLRTVVGLTTVHIHVAEHQGVSCVGLQFSCTWDEEHAAGVLLHKRHLIEIGQADTSFHDGNSAAWAARQSSSSRGKRTTRR